MNRKLLEEVTRLRDGIGWAARALRRWNKKGMIDKDAVEGMAFQLLLMLDKQPPTPGTAREDMNDD
jgi:hypothetical protein